MSVEVFLRRKYL